MHTSDDEASETVKGSACGDIGSLDNEALKRNIRMLEIDYKRANQYNAEILLHCEELVRTKNELLYGVEQMNRELEALKLENEDLKRSKLIEIEYLKQLKHINEALTNECADLRQRNDALLSPLSHVGSKRCQPEVFHYTKSQYFFRSNHLNCLLYC